MDKELNTEVTPVEPVVATVPDDHLVEVVVNGEPVRKPWKEVKSGFMMQQDYTQKTQSLAEQRKELQTLYDQLVAKDKEFKDRDAEIQKREARIKSALGDTKPDEPQDDEVITVAQLRQALKDHETTLSEQFNKSVAEHTTKTEQQRLFEKWEEKTDEAVSVLRKEHPALEDIPELSLVLKRAAREFKPTNDKELVESVVKAGKSLAERLDKRFEERMKENAIRRRNVEEHRTEPRGGIPQFSTPDKTYGKGRKINWAEIEKDVIAAIESAE